MISKISIVIPVFNVAPYILRCLQSVVVQNYHDIECLLIDDCGIDDSIVIAKQFIQDYNGNIRFSIVSHPKNLGLSAARNTGMKAATGDYIYFMDSDDAITSDCIETLAGIAEKYPDADYVQGNIITGTDQLMKGDIDADVPDFCDDKTFLENIILCKTHRTAWNRLMKRSFLLNNSLFFPVGLTMEDHYWNYFVAKKAHAVAFTHKGTYFYYNNEGSIVNSKSKAAYIKNYSSYMTLSDCIIHDMLQRQDLQRCHTVYVGEAMAFCMINLMHLRSIIHWIFFWKFVCCIAWSVRRKFTWHRLFFLICLLPPLCYMIGHKGWRGRLRQYIAWKL